MELRYWILASLKYQLKLYFLCINEKSTSKCNCKNIIFLKGFLNAPLVQKIDSPESISMYTSFNGTQKYVEMDLFH